MKTFKDITFKPHPIGGAAFKGQLFFANGYGISVLGGSPFLYCDATRPYEVAILKGSEKDFDLCYDSPITDDVLGYQTEQEVEEILTKIQNLKS